MVKSPNYRIATLLLVLVLAACSSTIEATPAPTVPPTRTPHPTFTPAPTKVSLVIIAPTPTMTVPPTRTPMPTATPWWTEVPASAAIATATYIPTPAASVAHEVVYRSLTPDEDGLLRAFAGQALAHEMMRQIATEVQSGQMDGMEGFFGVAIVGALLQGIDPVLERAYVPPLWEHAQAAIAQQSKLRDIGRRWLDKQIDSSVVLIELSSLTPAPLDNVTRYVDFLKASGYSPEEVNAALTQMQQDMEAALEEAAPSP